MRRGRSRFAIEPDEPMVLGQNSVFVTLNEEGGRAPEADDRQADFQQCQEEYGSQNGKPDAKEPDSLAAKEAMSGPAGT
jgi:hypothetical protein